MCLQRTVGHTSAPLPTNLERIKWTSRPPSLVTKLILRIYIVNMKRNFLFMTVSPGILVTLRSNLRFWRKDGVRINIFSGKKKQAILLSFCPCFYRVLETLAKVWENSGEKVACDSYSEKYLVLPKFHYFFYNWMNINFITPRWPYREIYLFGGNEFLTFPIALVYNLWET